MAAWKRRSDMRKVCGHIFEDRNVQLYLNVHRRFGRDLVKSSGYTTILIPVSYTHLSHLLLAHGRMEEMI